MGETNITINFDAAKLDALEFALRKQRSSVQRRMAEMFQQLYESEVPEAVREYVDIYQLSLNAHIILQRYASKNWRTGLRSFYLARLTLSQDLRQQYS